MKAILIGLIFSLQVGVLTCLAQSTHLKLEAGAIYTGNFTVEVERLITQKVGIFCRLGMVRAQDRGIGEERGFPFPSGFLAKAGPLLRLGERWSLRGELAYSRVQKPDQTALLLDLNEIYSGVGVTVAYRFPAGQKLFIEPFGGFGCYQTRQIARLKAEGFGNDSYLWFQNVNLPRGAVSPIHATVKGDNGLVLGVNLVWGGK